MKAPHHTGQIIHLRLSLSIFIEAFTGITSGIIKAVASYAESKSKNKYRIFTQKDDHWTVEDAAWTMPDTNELTLTNFAISSHDWYLLYFSSETSEYRLEQYNEETKTTSDITPAYFKKKLTDTNNNFISMLEPSNGNTLFYYVTGFNELHEYHPSDGTDEIISQDCINSMTLFDHELYYICDTNRVKSLDLNSHTITQDIELNEVDDLPWLSLDSSGSIYVISSKGVLLYQPDQKKWCRLIQGSGCRFSSNLITSTAISQASDHSLYVVLNGSDNGLSRISHPSEEKKPEKRVLTIYSAYNWTGLSKDITQYMLEYSDVKIELKEALDINSESELLDAEIRSVNTSLLAGEGAVYSLPLRIKPMYYIYRDIVEEEHPTFHQLLETFQSTPDICYVSADSLKDVITFCMNTYASSELIQDGKFCAEQWKDFVMNPRSPIRCRAVSANNSFAPSMTIGINALKRISISTPAQKSSRIR